MKATLVLRTDKTNTKNFCPINIRIIAKGVISYLPTNISIHKDHWDAKKQLVKNKSVVANEANCKLQDDLGGINKIILTNYNEFKHLDANEIKVRLIAMINGEELPDFLVEAKKYVEKFKASQKIGTYTDRLSKLSQLVEFCPSLRVGDINSKMVSDYKDYLEGLGNSENTVRSKIKFLKTLYRAYCHRYNYQGNSNAFVMDKAKVKSTIKFLTETQLSAFEKLKMESTKQELYKDMFLFSVKGIGLRISDLLTLKWAHIDEMERNINKVAIKTGKTLHMKLPSPALEILKRQRNSESLPNDYVFAILDDSIEDLSDATVLDTAISRETASYNKFLKRCGEKIGLPFRLSSQKGRHSYATRAINKGMPLHDVQYTLGHASFKETEIYAKIVKTSVDGSIDKYLSE